MPKPFFNKGLNQLGPNHWLSEDELIHLERLSGRAKNHHSISRRCKKSSSLRKVKITMPKLNLAE